jgi:hypothetical protein
MKSLNQLGYMIVGGKPNEKGLCKAKIVNLKTGEVVAETDKPTTLEEVMPIATRFANENLTKAK